MLKLRALAPLELVDEALVPELVADAVEDALLEAEEAEDAEDEAEAEDEEEAAEAELEAVESLKSAIAHITASINIYSTTPMKIGSNLTKPRPKPSLKMRKRLTRWTRRPRTTKPQMMRKLQRKMYLKSCLR